MPRGNGTGPTGMGPMTGRGAGVCAGYNAPGFNNRGFRNALGRMFGGMRRGLRGGFGRINNNYNTDAEFSITKEQEVENLKDYRKNLENSIQIINDKLDTLEQKDK